MNRMAGLYGLDAYRVALEFYRKVLAATRGAKGHAVEQLTDSAESAVLNVAEAHPAIGADRARRFRIAADEASECWGALDLLEIRGTLAGPVLDDLRATLDRECAMLWRLSRKR
jgi:four helix bundle protein